MSRFGPLVLLASFVLMSGCASQSVPSSSPAPEAPPLAAVSWVNQTLFDMDVVFSSAQEGSADIEVPASSVAERVRLRVWVQMDEGVWDGFKMTGLPAACNTPATPQGLTISSSKDNGSGGSTCLSEPGPRTVVWTLNTGIVKGHLSIVAEVPEASPHTTRRVILDEDFRIGGAKPTGSIPFLVPEGTTDLFLQLRYDDGAYQDPAFTLAKCRDVGPTRGLHASAGGAVMGLGSVSRGVTYRCGTLATGEQAVAWSLKNGILLGHIIVQADVLAYPA